MEYSHYVCIKGEILETEENIRCLAEFFDIETSEDENREEIIRKITELFQSQPKIVGIITINKYIQSIKVKKLFRDREKAMECARRIEGFTTYLFRVYI
jgi:ribosomal protein L23